MPALLTPARARLHQSSQAGHTHDFAGALGRCHRPAALELASQEFGVRLPGDIIWGRLLTGEVEIDMSWLDD